MKRQHTQQPTHPVFTVGVAGSLVGVSPQTLRKWERHGLLSPVREGHQRRRLYSWRDIERAQQIRYLVIRKHIPLRDVKLQLRLASVRKAPAAPAAGRQTAAAACLCPQSAGGNCPWGRARWCPTARAPSRAGYSPLIRTGGSRVFGVARRPVIHPPASEPGPIQDPSDLF